jgi:hypothetical protein
MKSPLPKEEQKVADTVKKYIRRAMTIFAVLMFVLGLNGRTVSARPLHSQDAAVNTLYYGVRGHSAPQSPDMIKILAALETKVQGRHRLLEKAEEKLAGLSGKDLKLIASLCDRIPVDGRSAESDIAFLLATALIILS